MHEKITDSTLLSLLNVLVSEAVKLETEIGKEYDLSNSMLLFKDLLSEHLKLNQEEG